MEKTLDKRERFAALVRLHGRSMFCAARTILDSDADAEDAVGEAILLAWQSFDRLKQEGAARSWILRITVNCAYGQRRKQGRVVYMEELPEAAGASSAREDSGVWEAVCRLKEDQRLVVMLYYYEGMPVADIARVLDLPQGTVKSRLSRGRERLRMLLREEETYGL